jgi:hypothetical protein
VSVYTGNDLVDEMYELMASRLPMLSRDDPKRQVFVDTVRDMGAALGRPAVRPVTNDAARIEEIA